MPQALPKPVAERLRRMIVEEMKPLPVDRFEVRSASDSDGDAAIFVDVWHPFSTTPVTGRQLADVQYKARQILSEVGDDRFPYVQQHFADAQSFASAA